MLFPKTFFAEHGYWRMSSNNSLNDPANAKTVDSVIISFSERLGDDFVSETNHDSHLVEVFYIPEEHKAELTQLLGNQGYEVSYE